MSTSKHGLVTAALVVVLPVAVLLGTSAAADAVGALFGPAAGVLLVLAVVVACWLRFAVGIPRRHPAPARRPAPGRDPELTAPPAVLAGSR